MLRLTYSPYLLDAVVELVTASPEELPWVSAHWVYEALNDDSAQDEWDALSAYAQAALTDEAIDLAKDAWAETAYLRRSYDAEHLC